MEMPELVVMGSARVISSLATRLRPEEGLVLQPGYVPRWQELRTGMRHPPRIVPSTTRHWPPTIASSRSGPGTARKTSKIAPR